MPVERLCEVFLVGSLEIYREPDPRFLACRPGRGSPEVEVSVHREDVHEEYPRNILFDGSVAIPGQTERWPAQVSHNMEWGWAVIRYELCDNGDLPALITALYG